MKVAYLPQRQKRQNIILAILLIGLPLLLFAAYQIVQISSRAGIGSEPKNVVVSSVSSSMITISWTTDSATMGSIIPMDGDKKKTAVRDSRNSGRLYTHYVELDSLEPNTKYSFLIKSEDKEYTTSDGKSLEFTTLKVSSDVTPGSILGNIKGGSGADVLVYAFFTDKSTYPVSAQGGSIGSNGSWIISLSDSRKISDGTYAKIVDSTRITLIGVDGKGKTAKLEGTRLELFDSNGELKPTQEFVLGDSGDVYTLLPPQATLSVTTIQPEPTPTPTPEPTPTPTPEPTPTPTPTEEEAPTEDVVDEEFTRVYRIVHQLTWQELSNQGDTASSSFSGAKTIRVVDVTDSGFKIIWVSDKKEKGYVNYGVSATDLDMKAVDTRDSSITGETGEYFVHNVELDRLQRETKYYFEVVSGDNKYDNNGSKYQQSTVKLIDPPAFKTVGISVDKIPDNGEVAIIAHIEDKDSVGSSGKSKEISCLVPSGEDQCTLVISNSRVEDGSKFYEYTDDDLLILEPYTTFEAEKYTSKLQGLEGSGIDMPLERIASSNVPAIKIAALSNYGLTDSPNEVISNGENIDSANIGEIPKTGILDNFISILILSGNLVISGILIYIFTTKKEIKKGKMSKNI